MKRACRRFVALLLCMVLTLSLATAASASSVSWGDSDGGKTLTLTISEWSYQRVAVTDPIKTWHRYGTTTDLSPYGTFTATINAEYTSTSYVTKLVQAMNLEGLRTTYTASGEHTAPLAVAADETSGFYTLGVLFDTKSGAWGVSRGMLMSASLDATPAALNPLVESGTLYYAPRGTVYGYVAMPVA